MPEIDRPGTTGWIACVPVGSHEQHGPHLPFDVDTRIAVAISAGAAAASDVPVWIGPAITVGSSAEHDGFAGTVSLSEDTTVDVLVQVACSLAANAHGCDGILFVNGHGGNAAALHRTLGVLRHRGVHAAAWSPSLDGGDAHAGCTETSVMLHLHPGSVRMDLAEPGNTAPLTDLIATMRVGGVRAVSGNGVLGDPTGADADSGASIMALWIASLADEIRRFASRGSSPPPR
jgi:creatinine amidohydrolase